MITSTSSGASFAKAQAAGLAAKDERAKSS